MCLYTITLHSILSRNDSESWLLGRSWTVVSYVVTWEIRGMDCAQLFSTGSGDCFHVKRPGSQGIYSPPGPRTSRAS